MNTSVGRKNFVLSASAPEFQPENPYRRFPNAYAREFQPNPDRRCLFLTFSNGFPLTEDQIFSYFTRMHGPFVEDVFVKKPRTVGGVHKPGLFGKVMFKYAYIPDNVMGIREKVFLIIDGVPVYCKRYVSQKSNAGARRDGHQ